MIIYTYQRPNTYVKTIILVTLDDDVAITHKNLTKWVEEYIWIWPKGKDQGTLFACLTQLCPSCLDCWTATFIKPSIWFTLLFHVTRGGFLWLSTPFFPTHLFTHVYLFYLCLEIGDSWDSQIHLGLYSSFFDFWHLIFFPQETTIHLLISS